MSAEQKAEIDGLGARCGGCGHPASFHPSMEHATAYIASTNGRYAPECSCKKGNEVNQFGAICCRCKATREEVARPRYRPGQDPS